MNKLHSMELYLLEELENCEGSFDAFDIRSLHNMHNDDNEPSAVIQSPTRSTIDHERPALEEWEISLYEVEFLKRSKWKVTSVCMV